MKSIIKGKLYDTEKAELITKFTRKLEVTSLLGTYKKWCDCELYKTKKGAWFEVEGLDLASTNLNVISEERAKDILSKANPDMYMELYDDVEEA